MCGHEHGQTHGEARGESHGHGRRGSRGFGRRGFPDRTQLLERLQGYRQHLESELGNVQDLIARLGDESDTPAEI